MTEVLTTKQAAEALQLHPYTVTALLRSGALSGVRTSGGKQARWRIPRQAIDEYLGVRARTYAHPGALRPEDV